MHRGSQPITEFQEYLSCSSRQKEEKDCTQLERLECKASVQTQARQWQPQSQWPRLRQQGLRHQ